MVAFKHFPRAPHVLIGLLKGEGIGPEVINAARLVAQVTGETHGFQLELRDGGLIGLEAKKHHAKELTAEVIEFCSNIFSDGGAILSGPGGGRFVYDLRKEFKLFYKLNPLNSFPELAGASRLKSRGTRSVDILLIRENLEGLYQGFTSRIFQGNEQLLEHRFSCSESNVRQLLERAGRYAVERSGQLTVVVKRGAFPEISTLWEECATGDLRRLGIRPRLMDVDFAAYQLLHDPADFDVIASPNCFGDILADLGGLFFGSRGLTYGASFSTEGFGVYQTNHGCAYDLANTNTANPVGQILSMALLLRESFHLTKAADAVFEAIRSVWGEGWRTADLAEPGCRVIGTDAMAEKIAAFIQKNHEPVDA